MPVRCASVSRSIPRERVILLSGLLLGLLLGPSLLAPCFADSAAPATASTAAAPVDLSGFWQIKVFTAAVPRTAKLTPQAMALLQASAREMASGKVIPYFSRWCNFVGMPFLMGQSPPINIVQGSDEILILAEQNSAARHIYLDGRPHPAPTPLARTTDGHSVGRWQGEVLVVDTTNFSDNGAIGIPGGGYRTPTSHLVERFQLLSGGQSMQIESTWDDPNVFTEPHSYTSIYEKLPPDTYAYEDACDASDAAAYSRSGGSRSDHMP